MRYLNSLALPAIAGLFLFNKWYEDDEIEDVYPSYGKDESGLSGVERYLKKIQETQSQHKSSETLEQVEISSDSQPIQQSGVARYLDKQEKTKLTGVGKYLLKVAIADRDRQKALADTHESSVTKYLKNMKDKPVLTGVAKYIKHQESLPQPSKVAKYIKKVSLESSNKSAKVITETGVAKYLKIQESLPQPSRVSKYISKMLADAKQNAVSVKDNRTGVARYLENEANKPQASSVSKYLVRLAMESKGISVTGTKVDQYVRALG